MIKKSDIKKETENLEIWKKPIDTMSEVIMLESTKNIVDSFFRKKELLFMRDNPNQPEERPIKKKKRFIFF